MDKITAFISEFKNLSMRRKSMIIGIISVALIIGIGIPYLFQFFSKTSNQNAAFIQLTVDKSKIKIGQTATATIILDSSKEGVEVADFFISYDPDAVTMSNIHPGTFFSTYPIKEIGKDTIRIAAVATVTEKSIIVPNGKGTIATFTITGKNHQRTIIDIDRQKTKIATDGKNIANFSKGTSVTLDIQ